MTAVSAFGRERVFSWGPNEPLPVALPFRSAPLPGGPRGAARLRLDPLWLGTGILGVLAFVLGIVVALAFAPPPLASLAPDLRAPEISRELPQRSG